MRVLKERQAAHVEAAADAGAADGNADFLAIARLGIDARREGQRVAHRDEETVGIFLVGVNIGAARCGSCAGLGFGGKGRGRNDDSFLDAHAVGAGFKALGVGWQAGGKRDAKRGESHGGARME